MTHVQLEVQWSHQIHGLKRYILFNVETGEIVDDEVEQRYKRLLARKRMVLKGREPSVVGIVTEDRITKVSR